jgi:recombinational DNA repair protein RecT
MDKQKLIKDLNLDTPNKATIVDMEKVAERFTETLQKIHHKSESDSWAIYEREAMYYKKSLLENSDLAQCTGVSLFSAILEIAVQNISIQPGQKSEAYLQSRNANAGTKDKPVWIKAATLMISAYGELAMRINAGQIVRASNPIVIYEGDIFQPYTNDKGDLVVKYQPQIPRASNKIIACYVQLVLPNDGRDYKWLDISDIERLKGYSTNKGKTTGNALYGVNGGQIDPGFLEAKTIKHAFRSYRKLSVGDSVKMESDVTEEFEEKMNEQSYQPTAAPQQAPQPTAQDNAAHQQINNPNGTVSFADNANIPF